MGTPLLESVDTSIRFDTTDPNRAFLRVEQSVMDWQTSSQSDPTANSYPSPSSDGRPQVFSGRASPLNALMTMDPSLLQIGVNFIL